MGAQLKLVADASPQTMSPTEQVFDFWKTVMEKPRAQLGPTRSKSISSALAIGYSVDDLQLAIVGCKFDAWSQGQNDRSTPYNDVELICRNETKIDRFMELGEVYMKKTAERDAREAAEKKGDVERHAMTPDTRARLDAILARHKRKL